MGKVGIIAAEASQIFKGILLPSVCIHTAFITAFVSGALRAYLGVAQFPCLFLEGCDPGAVGCSLIKSNGWKS